MKRIQNINLNTLDTNKSYIEINGVGWRSPSHISIKDIINFMELEIPDKCNINLVAFTNQDVSVNTPPGHSSENNLQISADDNFLYIWVKNRWKRVPLSSF